MANSGFGTQAPRNRRRTRLRNLREEEGSKAVSKALIRIETGLTQFGEDLDWLRQLVWVTREGMHLKLSEMSDSHLNNAIAWIDRHEERLDASQDHYAQLAAISGANRGIRVRDGFTGRVMTLTQWAHHVSETVAWFKLCREGMKLERDHRDSRKRIGWGEMAF